MTNGKTCTKCCCFKSLDEFSNSKDKKDGKSSHCKECIRLASVVRYQKEKESRRQKYLLERESKLEYARNRYPEIRAAKAIYSAEYRLKNKERLADYYKKRYWNNRDLHLENRRGYLQNNRGLVYAQRRARRLSLLLRMPKWLTVDDRNQIASFYKKAVALSNGTGVPHQVDHIVPLQGKLVSGLHVPWNLQVIPASENFSKSNRFGEV